MKPKYNPVPILSLCLTNAGITRAELAQRVGVTPGLVSHWISGYVRISAERALQIEQATDGAIPRHLLRPDLFGGAIRFSA
jgi:DNA-binding transcriptional regulator YdaS (Cro superfamily)